MIYKYVLKYTCFFFFFFFKSRNHQRYYNETQPQPQSVAGNFDPKRTPLLSLVRLQYYLSDRYHPLAHQQSEKYAEYLQ